MRMSDTISGLKKAKAAMHAMRPAGEPSNRLLELPEAGANPGSLRGFYHVPEGLEGPAPLVVVLHGCTQTAAAYDHGSGWSRLADRHGFALLFPEQQRANNPNLCFNWFSATDTRRGSGEAGSIAAMVQAMRAAHDIDARRIFVTGLSAGGAMASVMLATYPELFAAGAIIAGIPYGCATGVAEAFECMGGRAHASAAELGANVRAATSHKGPWPRVSVWQGSADHTVVPSNAEAVVLQWTNVHGLPAKPSRTESVEGYPHRVWLGADGTPLIEHYSITGMAHGTPLMPGNEEGQSGAAGAHMLDAAISSTDRIAAFFGIAEGLAKARVQQPEGRAAKPVTQLEPVVQTHAKTHEDSAAGVQRVIEDALKAAGLMR